jgi:hypothetical protein
MARPKIEDALPLYAFIGTDAPDALAKRPTHRPAHLAGLERLAADGRIVHAGPLLDEAGAPRGSLVLFEAPTLAEAREIAARDPYVTEGIFARYEVLETKAVFGR